MNDSSTGYKLFWLLVIGVSSAAIAVMTGWADRSGNQSWTSHGPKLVELGLLDVKPVAQVMPVSQTEKDQTRLRAPSARRPATMAPTTMAARVAAHKPAVMRGETADSVAARMQALEQENADLRAQLQILATRTGPAIKPVRAEQGPEQGPKQATASKTDAPATDPKQHYFRNRNSARGHVLIRYQALPE